MDFDYIKYKQIIDHLDDDLSKHCFFQRLLYTTTGDIKHIYHLLPYLSIDMDNIPNSSKQFNSHYHLYENCDMLSFSIEQIHKGQKLIIFGAGHYGNLCYELLKSLNLPVYAFFDNDTTKHNTYINDIPILAPTYDLENNVAIIIAIEKAFLPVKTQLIELGYNESNIYCPEKNWLVTFFNGSYFDSTIFEPSPNEIFVDAGAYQGETAIEFSNWCPNFEKIYCFEPDAKNFKILNANLQQANLTNIECHNMGLLDHKCKLHFERCGDDGTGSHITENGTTTINVDALDNILNGRPVTYIKMDIEGSELDALEGAKTTIITYKPKLAICIYHKPEDIYTIPLYLLSLVPEYRFKIRHYSSYAYDTILYAYIAEEN